MEIIGWYYLHTNGDLIYKRDLEGTAEDILKSDFSRAFWPFNPKDREGAWDILVESLAAGANQDRVFELAKKWGCDDTDADIYAERLGIEFIKDDNQWMAVRTSFIKIQEPFSGFGDSKLQAMADLAVSFGYKATKLWGLSFKDFCDQQ